MPAVSLRMGAQLFKSGLVVAAIAVFVAGPACSATSENGDNETPPADQHTRIAEMLHDVPDGELTRFILTLSTSEKGDVSDAQANAVLETLHYAGAKAEWLEGSPVILATCTKADIYRALETGYIASIQVDRVKTPYK